MAEVRIPTEQIPVDILKRLQDIVDGKSFMGPQCRAVCPTSMSAPSFMPFQPSCLSVSGNTPFFTSLQSSAHCQGSTEGIFSMAKFPPAVSSSSSCMFATAAVPYTSAASAVRLPPFRTLITAHGGDEVDGGSCDPGTQLSGPSPRKRRLVDVLDDSGIVHIFHTEDDAKSAVVSEHNPSSQKDSDVVSIFADMDTSKSKVKESTIVRALTPALLTPRPGSVHVFDNELEISSRKEWNFKLLHENASQSTRMPISPRPVPEACDTTPRRSSRPFSGHCDVNKQCNIGNTHKSDTICSKNMSCMQNPQLKHSASEADKGITMRHFGSCSGNARRSPELPTPPQTPDDGDVDIGDDEVFTFTSVGSEDKYLSQTCGEATRKCTESTPRRRQPPSRHHSDRTEEAHQHLAQMPSSVGPTQQMSELSFGDRQKSRKRLSFDEVVVSQPINTNQHSYSGSPLLPQFPPQASTSTNNNLFASHASRVSQAGSLKSPSPLPKFHPHVMPSSFQTCPLPQSSPQPHQQTTMGNQKTSNVVNQLPAPHSLSFHPTSRRSPVQDVFAILEKAVQKRTSAPPGRSRLHSDSDYIPETRPQGLCGRTSPQPEQTGARRQTFSFGNRKPRDAENADELRNEDHKNSPTQTWPGEQKNCTEEDCYCSKIARNFLQMVERAYTGITQMDGTQAGFVRFRQELTQINDILRESLNIVHNIRAMCQHNVRSLPGFSATQAQ